MKKSILKILNTSKPLIVLLFYIITIPGYSQDIAIPRYYDHIYQSKPVSIKTVNGKLYAYIVLLFNENPHFLNLIQKDSIPLKTLSNEGFHIKEFKNYLKTIKDGKIKRLAQTMMSIYVEPSRFNNSQLHSIEKSLLEKNIVLKFSRDKNAVNQKVILDYCIFGKKIPVTIKHPLLKINEKIYNIQPYIYYDEFSTSNSTFYFDMIYINPEEVHNDYIIAKKIIKGEDVKQMFFVGSHVTDNIRYCLLKAFRNSNSIKDKIWSMFVIHELSHKIINNQYNYFDQVEGEEFSLCSTIYANPYLGLSVLYSYLNYNAINPHRIAAMNFVKYIAKNTGKTDIIENPGLIKFLPYREIKTFSKDHFESLIKKLK